MSDTENIRLFKDIFVQIYLPFSIKIREQAVIRMALFNYNPNSEEHTVSNFLISRIEPTQMNLRPRKTVFACIQNLTPIRFKCRVFALYVAHIRNKDTGINI